jgi:hypothetical protein
MMCAQFSLSLTRLHRCLMRRSRVQSGSVQSVWPSSSLSMPSCASSHRVYGCNSCMAACRYPDIQMRIVYQTTFLCVRDC